jgi:hypothetical protein
MHPRSPRVLPSALAFFTTAFALIGCAPNLAADAGKEDVEVVSGDGDGGDDGAADSGDYTGGVEDTGEPEDLEQWIGANLQIRTPVTDDFLPYGEPAEFEAVIVGADGAELDFDDIAWRSSVGGWTGLGATFEDSSLDVGRHTLTAEATLPDGTRLASQVAGVTVQAEVAGTYVGNLIVDLTGEYNGTPLTASCIGAAVVYVDGLGERVQGESTCVLSLFGFDTSARHEFDLAVDGTELAGTANLDLSFFNVAFDAVGEIDDDTIRASWTGTAGGLLDVAGDLDIDRISRDIGG